jgi:hypothetical protein
METSFIQDIPDWRTNVVRMRKTAIFVRRSRDVTLHDGCHGILAVIKMVACDVTGRIDQSEEAIYTKCRWETSHREVSNRRANEILCCSCLVEQTALAAKLSRTIDCTISSIPGKGALCAHASLSYVTGSKFRNMSPEALSYGSGLFKLLVGKVASNLLKFKQFCILGYDAV